MTVAVYAFEQLKESNKNVEKRNKKGNFFFIKGPFFRSKSHKILTDCGSCLKK